MGVPAFFKWLALKYPLMLETLVEAAPGDAVPVAPDGAECAWTDGHEGEPHSVAVDNLYLDCNGIVHPCCHPEDGPQPRDEKEMFANVAELINRLVRATRPRRLLYLALDGVAPRAKLNQQRARRFCAARERDDARAAEAELRARSAATGRPPPAPLPEPWDHNVITPGTEFMDHLAQFLRDFATEQTTRGSDTWRRLTVIISDAGTPVRRDSRERAKREGEKGGIGGRASLRERRLSRRARASTKSSTSSVASDSRPPSARRRRRPNSSSSGRSRRARRARRRARRSRPRRPRRPRPLRTRRRHRTAT